MRRLAAFVAAAAVVVAPLPAQAAGDPSSRPDRGIGDGRLRALAAVAEDRGNAAVRGGDPGNRLPTSTRTVAGWVVVEVETTDRARTRSAIAALGGRVTGSAGSTTLQVSIQADALGELETAAGIASVRVPRVANAIPAVTAVSGTAGAEAVSAVNAAAWHDAGITGFGVKVGIIDYFDESLWSAAKASGDVPAAAGTFCQLLGDPCSAYPASVYSSLHGVAVAEVVHDIAPQAELYRVSAYSAADFTAALDWLQARGVRILTRSLTSEYDGPGDGRGVLNDVAADAVARGMTLLNAAGNSSGATGAGGYWRGSWRDTDGDDWLEFGANGEYGERLAFRCGFSSGVRWSDFDELDRTDYDVYVYDNEFDTAWESASEGDQNTQAPIESVACDGSNDTDYLAIQRFGGGSSTGDVLEFQINSGVVEGSSNPYSAALPIVDSTTPGVVGVGAMSGSGIAYYSSRGPTNDGRTAPDLAAVSGISSKTYGTFSGTSAATPAAAAVAALLLQETPPLTPAQVEARLRQSVIDRGAVGVDNDYGAGELRLPAPAPPKASADYVPLIPRRILDTRIGLGAAGIVAAGGQITLPVIGGNPPVPLNARGVALTVTAVGGSKNGFVTAYPCDQTPRPVASTLNTAVGRAVANLAMVRPSAAGTVCLYASQATHLVVDLAGYAPPVAGFRAASPERLLDSRSAGVRLKQGETWAVPVIDVGQGQVPVGAEAVALNLTMVAPTADGYVTAYPCGSATPTASSLNAAAGQIVANASVVQVGTYGAVCFYASQATHLVVDLVGWWPAGSSLDSIPPSRLLDSRIGTGAPARSVKAGEVVALQVTGAGVTPPPDSSAAVPLNVTVVGLAKAGFVTVYPCGAIRPTTSNVNFAAGQIVAAQTVAQVGAQGKVCLYASADLHLVADLGGWFNGS